jgi:shikimate kinase
MMLKNKTIYIIGFMGSGKTTAGKKLASRLGWSFIDLDRKIEEKSGYTIPELFSKHGEDYFRNIESDVLKNLEYETNTVISTGGGTPCFGDNMEYMLSTGLTIYLKLTPGQLKSRLTDSSQERPLIKNLDCNNILAFIEEKLAYREKWYSRADIFLEGPDLNINLLHSLVNTRINS